jgi:hypothetical protein
MSELPTIGLPQERRTATPMRTIFVEAFAVIEPFFSADGRWLSSAHEHLAYRALQERFPELPGEQIFVVVAAAGRLLASGRTPTP